MLADPLSLLKSVRRPSLLVRAAHLVLHEYNRERSLRKLLPDAECKSAGETFDRLLAHEADMNQARREGGTAYSITRHIELLAALIVEARLVRCETR